ncbi:similar to Saccharomyces cerevisiae YGR285C ZUO1 Ribosome-associated chaperone [Maudiozyma saulgeensis]|uniref:Similar to Saccharomyces cerevisiae YGR285C ZUO1 Ribosome-associated chaperone n=1 Tax=Maudiozyma saulgeensis TaxID=1789683 RepID=A0A1X7R4A7_9SACH|nr:similar to Saccharomyces cerevisiae YGR285C ZUO1 Ribosome-associated chaperone [Kazachstania saulgeensis]
MLSLPALTSDITVSTVAGAKLTPSVRRPIEPVGKDFMHHATRTLRNHTWSEFEKIQAEQNVKTVDESNVDPDELLFDTELADETLLGHDARDWKTADLYAAMGLSKLRYTATENQIIKAHRKQVVKYHPDKQSASGASLDQDGFFKIIQKAFETLTDKNKRKQYDSCDFVADVEPPKKGSEYDFFEAWAPVFASEARFSKKTPVPELGNLETSQKEVEQFFSFWHRFDSWRTFEFLDEDVPDDSSNRDHKRYIERKNKAARDKKKTADNARLVKLVERAMNEDPRIKMFKEAEKKEKERKKWEAGAGARAEAEAKAKAEADAKSKAEEEAKAAANAKADKKKSKEAAKAAKKKNKRAIRNAGKDNDYFGDAAQAAAIDEQITLIVDSLDDEQLVEVSDKIKADASASKTILSETAKTFVESGKLPASLVAYFA